MCYTWLLKLEDIKCVLMLITLQGIQFSSDTERETLHKELIAELQEARQCSEQRYVR